MTPSAVNALAWALGALGIHEVTDAEAHVVHDALLARGYTLAHLPEPTWDYSRGAAEGDTDWWPADCPLSVTATPSGEVVVNGPTGTPLHPDTSRRLGEAIIAATRRADTTP